MNELKKLIDVKSIVTFIAFYFGTQSNKKKEVMWVVELDQFKTLMNSYEEPLAEMRDSL